MTYKLSFFSVLIGLFVISVTTHAMNPADEIDQPLPVLSPDELSVAQPDELFAKEVKTYPMNTADEINQALKNLKYSVLFPDDLSVKEVKCVLTEDGCEYIEDEELLSPSEVVYEQLKRRGILNYSRCDILDLFLFDSCLPTILRLSDCSRDNYYAVINRQYKPPFKALFSLAVNPEIFLSRDDQEKNMNNRAFEVLRFIFNKYCK